MAPRVPDKLREAVAAALDKKGLGIKVIHIGGISDFAEYFVICTGASARQVQAISDEITERLRAHGFRPQGVEGYRRGAWVLLDYGDVVVHVFESEVREHYGLERLWADGTDLTAAVR